MRGGADGVGASRPQLIPATILRKNFEFIAAIKPHEVPNRPEFYMIGSGITEASLDALTIGATCTHEDFRAPCFTSEEIAEAKTQLNAEQVAFDALTPEEHAAHTAAGGLASAPSPTWYTTSSITAYTQESGFPAFNLHGKLSIRASVMVGSLDTKNNGILTMGTGGACGNFYLWLSATGNFQTGVQCNAGGVPSLSSGVLAQANTAYDIRVDYDGTTVDFYVNGDLAVSENRNWNFAKHVTKIGFGSGALDRLDGEPWNFEGAGEIKSVQVYTEL